MILLAMHGCVTPVQWTLTWYPLLHSIVHHPWDCDISLLSQDTLCAFETPGQRHLNVEPAGTLVDSGDSVWALCTDGSTRGCFCSMYFFCTL